MGQGRDQAKNFLKDHPEMMVELRNKILSSKGIGQLLMTADSAENAADAAGEDVSPEAEEAAPKGKAKKGKNLN